MDPNRYRLYLDESGDHVFHDEKTLAQPGHRFLALVGCWFKNSDYADFFAPIIREIDKILAPHYGLTREEFRFLVDYDGKFRHDEEEG